MIYGLVTGHLPFPHLKEKLTKKNLSEFARLVMNAKLKFDGKEWLLISESLKDLLTGMLEKDQTKRMTIDAVLQHPWFSEWAILAQTSVITI